MGGFCCCCASEVAEQNNSPANFQYPVSEERGPLSSHISTVSALSMGILVDTNLDISFPDTYRLPPAPVPFGPPLTPPSNQEIPGNKVDVALQTTHTNFVQDTNLETKSKSLNSDGKAETNIELGALKESENENSEQVKQSAESFDPYLQDEEDVVPLVSKNMTQRTQKSSQDATTISTLLVYLNGWKEVIPVPFVIRRWLLALSQESS